MMAYGKAVVVWFGSAVLCLEPAFAQEAGARALGRGGAWRADPTDVGAAPDNIGVLSLETRYDVVAGAFMGPDDTLGLHGAAVDSRTSSVAMAAAYDRVTDDVAPTGDLLPGWKEPGAEIANPTRHEGVRVGIGAPLAKKKVGIGLLLRYDWRSSLLAGKDQAFNLGASIGWRPHPTLTLAAAGRNLLETGYADTTRVADLGARWAPGKGNFALDADAVAPLTSGFSFGTMGWHAGMEGATSKWLLLRGGYSVVEGSSAVGAGFGLVSEKATLDYGIRVELPAAERVWNALDLRLVF